MKRFRSDSASVTPAVIIMAFGIFMVIGMTWDGGGQFDAERRANMLAEEAARAGAQAIDVNAFLETGIARLKVDDATAAVATFCSGPDWPPQTTCTAIIGASRTEIQVNVTIVRGFVFLPSSVGNTVYGHAQVKLTQGVVDAGG